MTAQEHSAGGATARQHYSLSTERAVAAVIGPIGGVAVLGLALVIITAVLFVLSQTS